MSKRRLTLACGAGLWAASASLGQINPPLATSAAWLPWYQGLLAQRLAACPRARSTTYYFSQAGDDTSGDGTIAHPWKTLAKAQAVVNASPGDLALLFRRGDVWREPVGIDAFAPNLTIGDYGAGAKPLFTAFETIGDPAGWSPVPGTVNTYRRPISDQVIWVKEDDDLDFPYGRRFSLSSVENHEGSFWYDNSGHMLYIHPKHGPGGLATDPRTDGKAYERVIFRGSGVIVHGNGSRVENIRAQGWGMTGGPVTQQHGIESRLRNQDQAVFVGCESHYGNTHVMTHFTDQGGIVTFVDCRAGLTTYNTTGNTEFNSYASRGGQQTIWDHCVATQGTLPGDDRAYRTGFAFYGHTDVVNQAYSGLTICYDCTIRGGDNGCQCPGGMNDLPPAPSLADVQGFFVNEYFEGGPASGAGFAITVTNGVRIGGRFLNLQPPVDPSLSLAAWAQHGWLINSTLQLDISNQPYTFGLFNASPGTTSDLNIWNCAILVNTRPGIPFVVDWDSPSQSPQATLFNTVISITGGGGGSLQIGSPGTVSHNAYYGMDPSGYAVDDHPIVAPSPFGADQRPGCDSRFACAAAALPGGVVLATDQNGPVAQRNAVGPLEPPPCANCDLSTRPPVLNVMDFVCFQTKFSAGDPAANCDGSTIPPTLNIRDYICFLNAFVRACP